MIGRSSRYATSIFFEDGAEEFLGSRTPIDSSPRPDDRFYTVVEGDRLDLLAEQYLGKAELWWVIADYNEVAWPLRIDSGVILRIPSLETIALRGP